MLGEQIDQVTLHVIDLEKAIAFYSALLDTKFDAPVEINIAGKKARLALSDLGLGLAQLETPVEGVRAIGVKVGDIEDLKRRLAETGHNSIHSADHGFVKEAHYMISGVRFNFAEYASGPLPNRATCLRAALALAGRK